MSVWLVRCTQAFQEEVWAAVPPDARSRIDVFAGDVLRFGRSQNLVSRQDPEGEVAKLVEESVRGGALLRSAPVGRVLDVGSGAGFPGLVLAALWPESEFLLVERRRARCDFLERCARRMELPRVRVVSDDVRRLEAGSFDVATGKAVVEAQTFLDWIDPHLDPAGVALLFQREGWTAPAAWRTRESCVSLEDAARGARVAVLVERALTT